MIRRLSVAFLLVVLAGCASNGATVPVAEPASEPEFVSTASFAEAIGPLEPVMAEAQMGPLVVLDGRQLHEGEMPQTLGRIIFERLTDAQREAVGPNPVHPRTAVPTAYLTTDDIRYIRVIRPDCGTEAFGEAGRAGLFLLFTWAWDGPFPEPRTSACARGAP